VTIPSVTNGYPVTTIGTGAFHNQISLTGVTIPDSVTTIADYAFYGCSSLPLLLIPDSVTNIGASPFWGCSNLTSVTIPERVTSIGDYVFQLCPGLGNVIIGNSVTSIGESAFNSCFGLTNVTIGYSVTNIGLLAFSSCPSLHQAFFLGNAPTVNGRSGSTDITLFSGETGTVYYLPGTTGWGAAFGGWPTAMWYQSHPRILSFGVQRSAFQLTISWATNTAVVVEASTDLSNWTPVITNNLVNGTNTFRDSAWTNYPQRFYRARSP
jgi:hypothetical protein